MAKIPKRLRKKSKVKSPAVHRKGVKKKALLGKAMKPNFAQNCTACFNYYNCRDPDKSSSHLCSKFSDITDHFETMPATEVAVAEKVKASTKKKSKKSTPEVAWKGPKDDSEFGIQEFMMELLNTKSYAQEDFVFEDGDLIRATNFLQWTASKNFLGEKPFPKQVEVGINLLQEYCPRCSNIDWITNIPKSTSLNSIRNNAVLLRHGICPRCKGEKSEFVGEGELVDYYELVGMAGQRSGKTAVVGLIASYLCHGLIKTPNPSKTFGLTQNMILTATFAAVTFQQAQQNVWNPYVKPYITQSPWFTEYIKMLDYFEDRNNAPLYKVMDTYVSFFHKNLFLSPYTPDKRTLRGATRCIGSVDELGWFDNGNTSKTSVRANSTETLAALRNSLGTLIQEHTFLRKYGNNDLPNPMMLNVSSPSSITDGICTRYNMSNSDPSIYAFHYPTWDFSPKYERNDPQIISAYARNKIEADRDWGAKPPMSTNPFIGNPKIFKNLTSKKKKGKRNLISLSREVIITNSGASMTGAYCSIKKAPITNRIMAIDAGSVNNSFGVAVGRIDPDTEYPVLEGLGEVVAYEGKEISFTNVFNEVLAPIITSLNVVMIVSDRWQSKKILQDAEEEYDISYGEYSLTKADFLNYKEDVVEGRFIIPKSEMPISEIISSEEPDYKVKYKDAPIAHFISQNLTVIETIKTVEKGNKLTDDLFRCVVLMHSFLKDPDIREDFLSDVEIGEDYTRQGLGISSQSNSGQGVSELPGIGVSVSGGSPFSN